MIQRIQSLWLLLAAACSFASYKFPYYSGTNQKGIADYQLNGTENFLLMAVTAVTGALALFLIFLFKNRKMQLRLCLLGIVLEALLIFLYYREVRTFSTGTLSLTSILQSAVIVLFFLAARAINKDEKMVKESDRLR
ncbi:MAG TPA: DUF4293 domain-containing protein [Ferruginibacter sp.]|nr:DUF4293 domain-containing protein [Chitinophagaceae bacterium]HRI23702.1 DUF4293 domain-containing protein [Ferruginibacter sp.]